MKTYTVLIACRDDKTGKAYKPGDTVKPGDFPADVIYNWLALEPPVLKVADKGADNGSDTANG